MTTRREYDVLETAFTRLLQAGVRWRDARSAAVTPTPTTKTVSTYFEAIEKLEEVVNELRPQDTSPRGVVHAPSLEEALAKSLEVAYGTIAALFNVSTRTVCRELSRG